MLVLFWSSNLLLDCLLQSQQKITHMWRRWGKPQEFPFGIYWWLWKTRKIKILKNEKKLLEISSLYTCIKNHNHMRYCSWDTEWDKFLLLFWVIFCYLPPSTHNNPENQNFEKMKKAFADVIKKHNHMMYAYSDME